MKNNVLVITSCGDVHADFLCPKLEKLGVQVFRFDTDDLNRYEIDFRISPDTFSIRDKKKKVLISQKNIGSVWFRKPAPDRTCDKLLDDEAIKFSRGESKEWIKSIALSLQDSLWITAPWILYPARIKTVQLSTAKNIGLSVPKTLVTRDRKLIREFFDSCPKGMIAKTLKTQYVESCDSYYTLSTQGISHKDLGDSSLYISPCIFQEKITTLHELRIVAIGRRLYPFKVIRKSGATILDIRANGLENIEFSPCEISRDLRIKILKMLDHFNLLFSSMDFLVDISGKEYFIDLNPNGQWLWLELKTGIVMSDVLAEMLIHGTIPN